MGILNMISNYAAKKKQIKYMQMMNGMSPVFSSFGTDVYASDITKGAIRCIANEIQKLNPRHIVTDPKTGLQKETRDEINRLLKFGPNQYMTTSDFLTKIVYLREKTNNVYIYPAYEKIPLSNGRYKRRYTGFYPLNPITTEYLEDDSGRLFIKFTFLNGYDYTMPYSDIIHWRKDFFENDIQGGDASGNPDDRAELKLLEADNTIIQSVDKGVKVSMGARGILKINTMMTDDEQDERRMIFEKKLENNKSAILTADLKSEFVPIKIDPKVIDKDTMQFVMTRILANRGVSLAIYNGTFTEEEYQAFYEKTLEHMIVSLGRVFSKTLFTERELEVGNEIIFYNQGLMFTNTANKIKAVDIMSKIGILTDNQIGSVFGYPPFEGGDIRHQSLNFINREIADTYQLSKNKGKENADGKE